MSTIEGLEAQIACDVTNGNVDAAMGKPADEGYPKLARMMRISRQTAIFRRFGELNMITLLRLQAELLDLEHQLRDLREEDAHFEVQKLFVTDFRLMQDNLEDGDSLQYNLLVTIAEKLREYNSALAQVQQLDKFEKPSHRETGFLRDWLIRPAMGNSFLSEREAKTWDAEYDGDFLTLFPRELETDAFTRFLNGALLDLYHRIWGHKRHQTNSPYPGTGIREYKDERIAKISNSFSVIISSLLPTIVILVLYFVKSMIVRIGLMIIFTAVFALSLAVFTGAKKIEIFSATAAFAAVEVVFIGSTNTAA